MKRFAVLLLTSLAAALPGCGGPRTYPVSGRVTLQGKPLPGAILAFHPTGSNPGHILTALTDEEGKFRLRYDRHAGGAPAGSYAVTVVWREARRDGDEVLRNGRNLLPRRYEKPETSGLSVTVAEQANLLPEFDLATR